MSNQKQRKNETLRSKEALLKDLEGLRRTSDSSVEIAISMTTAITEDLIQRLRQTYPSETDRAILLRAREILSIGR
ncbi:MAG: hypothetical protein ACXAB4_13525 [Candidatus Hodarchaeales archaeon]